MNDTQILLDIVILGNANTGKQSLRNFLLDSSTAQNPRQVHFKIKSELLLLFMSMKRGGSRINMTQQKYRLNNHTTFQVRYWLTSGDFRSYFNFIKTIENIKGVIVLVDLSNRKSAQKLDPFFIGFQKRDIPLFLVGNKTDLNREVSMEEMMNVAKKYNAQYIEVSLQNEENTEELKKAILLSSFIENDHKGSCNSFIKNTRYALFQRKKSLLYRIMMETYYGDFIRKDILDQTLERVIPTKFLKGEEEMKKEEQTFQDQREQSIEMIEENNGACQFFQKPFLIRDLQSCTMQFITYGPQKIETVLQ